MSEETDFQAIINNLKQFDKKSTPPGVGAGIESALQLLERRLQDLQSECDLQKSALRESEERFKAIADYTYAWESWVGRDGELLWVNPAVEKFTGFSVAECFSMAEYPDAVVHEDDRARIRHLLRQAVSKRTTGNDVEFRIRRKSGDLRWMAISWQPIYGSRGRFMGMRSSIRDISEHKRGDDLLKKSHDELERQVAQRTAEIRSLQERLQAENIFLKEELAGVHAYGEIIGESPSLKTVISRIELVAPTSANVLIMGESGTGKELIAREIHSRSQRRERPLIKVNCATIPKELYESEFFGHVKGAFTGAVSDRIGRFEAAGGGTLFLDEVAEIPLSLQGKLLRVLQEGEFDRVGEAKTRKVDVRIIAVSNKNLMEEIRNGRFREDLYYRLNVFPIEITPLRSRKEDIPLLARHFIEKFSNQLNRPAPRLSKANLMDLQAYHWPGNVRELQNVLERALILSPHGRLRLDVHSDGLKPEAMRAQPDPQNMDSNARVLTEREIKSLEKSNMIAALVRCGWRIYGSRGAARLLGIKPTTLIERMKRMGIDKKSFAATTMPTQLK